MMQKQNLTRAHQELFRRGPDESFPSLQALYEFCQGAKEQSQDHWRPPSSLVPHANGGLRLDLGEGKAPYRLNDWSFTQLCGLAGASKDTVNRLTPATARQVLIETLPQGDKPLQLYSEDGTIRSIHGTTYTRLYNADLVMMLREFAVDFQPPQKAERNPVEPGSTAESRTSFASSSTRPAGRKSRARLSPLASSSGTPRWASARLGFRPSGSKLSARITSSGMPRKLPSSLASIPAR